MASTRKPTQQSQNAQMRLIAAFARFFLNLINLRAFVGTTTSAIEKGKDLIHDEWKKGARDAAASQELKQLIAGKLADYPNIMDDFSDALAKRSIRLAGETVNAAGLVFTHSLLDGLISECCLISFMAKPEDWFAFVENRKVDFASLKTQKTKILLHQSAADFIKQLSRESMVKRFEYLHKVCAPRLKRRDLPTAWISHANLESFDELRHRIIHGNSFSRKITDIEQQVVFANRAGFSMLLLIQETYGLFNNKDLSSISSVRFLRALAIAKREFPEFFEILNKYAGIQK